MVLQNIINLSISLITFRNHKHITLLKIWQLMYRIVLPNRTKRLNKIIRLFLFVSNFSTTNRAVIKNRREKFLWNF